MRNYPIAPVTGILSLLVISLVFVPGCLSPQPDVDHSPPLPVTIPVTPDLTAPATTGPVPGTASDGPANHQNITPPKKLGLVVHSAALYRTLPGWNNKEGTSIAVINVSITNNLGSMYRLSRENIFIRTNRDTTFEHGGDRASAETAGNYLRFPLTIGPGETKTGSIVYIVYSGTNINDLVLTDSYDVLITKVDLNKVYTYG